MGAISTPPEPVRHYFVDEAGDGTLFDSKGRTLIGTEGCSRFFMLGLLICDSDTLATDLDDLRRRLLADPYFKRVPSMQPTARKTALAFHAKDDLPEVRREVFALLLKHRLKFIAVVKDKQATLNYVRQRSSVDDGYRYSPNEFYDFLVRRLFRGLLHRHELCRVYFARRGQSDRTAALHAAVERAQMTFAEKQGIMSYTRFQAFACTPYEQAGLQAVDYFLWALQRLYERGDDRYVELLWPAFGLVIDMDDLRHGPSGAHYTQKRPLHAAALQEVPGI